MTIDLNQLDCALAKLRAHGGARIDASGNAVRRYSGWERSYAAPLRHKIEQLDRITRFSCSRGFRMAHLVSHFGDREDRGRKCGRCGICSPGDGLALRFRAPSAGE